MPDLVSLNDRVAVHIALNPNDGTPVHGSRCVITALLILGVGESAHAQRAGAPVLELPLQTPGYGVAVQYARGATLPALGTLASIGGTLEWRPGRVTLAGGGAALDGDSINSGWSADAGIAAELCAPLRAAGATAGFSICNLLPEQIGLRARIGAGRSSSDSRGGAATLTEAALGVTAVLRATPPFASLDVWTGPRVHVRAANAVASGGTEGTTRVGAAWSLGLGLSATSGLGGSIVVEALGIERPPAAGFHVGARFVAGLHYVH